MAHLVSVTTTGAQINPPEYYVENGIRKMKPRTYDVTLYAKSGVRFVNQRCSETFVNMYHLTQPSFYQAGLCVTYESLRTYNFHAWVNLRDMGIVQIPSP